MTRTVSLLPSHAPGLLCRLVRERWPVVAGTAAYSFEKYGAGAVGVRWSELQRWARGPIEVDLYYVGTSPDDESFHRALVEYDPTREIVAFVGIDDLFRDATRQKLTTLPARFTDFGWYGLFRGGTPPPPECVRFVVKIQHHRSSSTW